MNAAAILPARTFYSIVLRLVTPYLLTPSLIRITLSADNGTGTRIISYLSARSCSSIADQSGLLLAILHNVRNDYAECS